MVRLCYLLPYKESLPPSTPPPAGEAQILQDIRDKSNQYLLKKLMGTTKSQMGPTELLELDPISFKLLNFDTSLKTEIFTR